VTQPRPATLASGGLSVPVGPLPVLLTEYAPIMVINTSVGSRIWLASDSNVSPATGVPLDPSTSYRWDTPGPLYAVLDPAATDPQAAVTLTGAGGEWSPSPVAIGAAVALQLATQGVPTKLLVTDLGSWIIAKNSVGDIGPDFTSEETCFLYVTFGGVPSGTIPGGIAYQWYNTVGGSGVFVGQQDFLYCNDSGFVPGVLLPCVGKTLQFTNPTPYDAVVRVVGYNRKLVDHITGNGYQSAGFGGTFGPANTVGSNTTLPLTQGLPFQGSAFLALFTSAAGATAQFSIELRINGFASNLPLMDSTQCHSSGGRLRFSGIVAFPAAPFDLVLVNQSVNSGGTYAVAVRAIPNY